MSGCKFPREIQKAAIEWFYHNQRRDLPWRKWPVTLTSVSSASEFKPDPYQVWVSEVMSQQTQIDTVLRYFDNWISLFPTVLSLAAASDDSVKTAWAGMGYYRRALYLKKGAKYIAENYAGKIPRTVVELCKVPGIGPYTAAAIASICFGEKVVSVDGNVVRVISRLRCERDFDPKSARNIKAVMRWGQELMNVGPCEDPGSFNQGLMELGARVCKPGGQPLCEECPLQRFCGAYSARERGEIVAIEGIIPLRATGIRKRKDKVLSVVHEFRHTLPEGVRRRFIVLQRPDDGLLGGMLEFPSMTYDSLSDVGTPVVDIVVERLRLGHSAPLPVGVVRHIFSHIDMEVQVYHALWTDRCESEEQKVCTTLSADLDVPASRIFLKTEEEIRASAASRLLLKIFQALPKCARATFRLPRKQQVLRTFWYMQGWYQFGYDGFPSGEVRRRFYRQRDDLCESEEEREVYNDDDRPVYYYPMHESEEEAVSGVDDDDDDDLDNDATSFVSPTPLRVTALEDFAGRCGGTAVAIGPSHFVLHGGALALSGEVTNASDVLHVSTDGAAVVLPHDASLARALRVAGAGPIALPPPRRFGHCAAALPRVTPALAADDTHCEAHASLVIGGASGDLVPPLLHDLRLRGAVLCDPWLCVTLLRGGAQHTAHFPLALRVFPLEARVFATLTPWPGGGARAEAEGRAEGGAGAEASAFAYLGGSGDGREPLPRFGLWLLRVDAAWAVTATPQETLGAEPPPRFGHAAAAHGAQLFVFGGVGRGRAYLDDLVVLDCATHVWREVFIPSACAVPPRAFHAAVVLPRPAAALVLIGGEARGQHEASVWRYNADTGEWAALRFPALDRRVRGNDAASRVVGAAQFLCARERRDGESPAENYFAALHGSLLQLLPVAGGVLVVGGTKAPGITPLSWLPARRHTLQEATALWIAAYRTTSITTATAAWSDSAIARERRARLVERSLAEEQIENWRRETRKRLRLQ